MIEVKGTIVGNLSTIQSSEVNTKETVVGSLGSTTKSVNGFTNVGNTYVADYKLPIANEETLGGVIVGDNLTVEEDGRLNAVVPTKVSELENDTGFINEIPEEYITDVELASKGYLIEVPSEYKTKEENDKLYQPIGDYALKTDIPEVPTKLSEFENDTSFISEVPEEYITESELSKSLSTKADKTEIPTKVSELENDSGFISEVPSEYVTETELNAKGYLTKHQDISHLATKDELHTHSNKEILDSISQENIDKWNAGGNKPCNVIVDAVQPTNGEPIWVKQGRNLCNTKSMYTSTSLDSYGNSKNDFKYWGVTNYIEVEPNTIYTMSGITYGSTSRYHAWYDENKNLISTIQRFLDTTPSKTYTSPSNAKYIRFSLFLGESGNGTKDERTTFQFELGKVATPYVPFIDEDNIYVRNTKGTYEQLYEMFPVSTTGGVVEETDPTVPEHVKAITQADIDKWNSGTGGGNEIIVDGDGAIISTEESNGTYMWIHNSDAINLEANAYYKLGFDKLITDTSNGKLIHEDGGIRIGKGVKQILVISKWNTWTTTCSKYINLVKNGTSIESASFNKGVWTANIVSYVDVIEDDYIEIQAYHNHTSSMSVSSNNQQTGLKVIVLSETTNVEVSGTGGGSSEEDTGWVDAELTSDFALYDGYSKCHYRKVGKVVSIEFTVKPTSSNNTLNSNTRTAVFTIPEEFRPAISVLSLCQGSGNNIFVVEVKSDTGVVNISRYRNSADFSSSPPGTSTWLPAHLMYFIE